MDQHNRSELRGEVWENSASFSAEQLNSQRSGV
jgi:hypothetical protein